MRRGLRVAVAGPWRVAQPDSRSYQSQAGESYISMSSLPKYYFQDIPAYVMGEIIDGMVEGKPEPTEEEMQEWLTWQLEREADLLLARYC